jgi:hypothetical protein
MTTTTVTSQQHHRLPFVAIGAMAAVILGLGIAGVAISNGQETAREAPQAPAVQGYSLYQHYYPGMTTHPGITHGGHLTRFHYTVSGGRVQRGQ